MMLELCSSVIVVVIGTYCILQVYIKDLCVSNRYILFVCLFLF